MSRITYHSSEFGSFNLMCHTCGAVGYHIDCDLTLIDKMMMDGLEYDIFAVFNVKAWFCECPPVILGLTRPDQTQLTMPVVEKSQVI